MSASSNLIIYLTCMILIVIIIMIVYKLFLHHNIENLKMHNIYKNMGYKRLEDLTIWPGLMTDYSRTETFLYI